ncbi:sulfotransferase 6B1-like [Discoglossus pictus]
MAALEELAKEVQKVLEVATATPQDKLLFTHNGVLYPSTVCNLETFQNMESFEAREDDLLLAAYPKCGSNWTIQLLQDMIKASYNKDPPPIMPMLEFAIPGKFEKLKEDSSPRVLTSHMVYGKLPNDFFYKKAKILVVIRNPKDTAVSLFHFHNSNPQLPNYSSWDEFFQDFISGKVVWGSYFDYALAWNKHIDDENVLIISFEEMKQDLAAAVKKVSNFFGMSLTEEQVQQISDKGTFKSMKEKAKERYGELGQPIFRKGEVGDWKNYFSEAQSQEVDAKFKEYLAGTKIGDMINYTVNCKW